MELFLDVLPQAGWDELQAMCRERGLAGAAEELRARKRKTEREKNMLQVAEYLLNPDEER